VRVKVICQSTKNIVATVEDNIYRATTIDDWELEKIRRLRTGPHRVSTGERLRPEPREIEVDVFSYEADHFQISSQWWGQLPAWCRRCGAVLLVEVKELRDAVRDRRDTVLVTQRAVR